MEVVVVGGSLAGLTFALACARHNIRTHVLERVHGSHQGGGTLGVDRNLLLRVVGKELEGSANGRFPVLAGRRRAATWQAIRGWLREQVCQRPIITFEGGTSVIEIMQNTDGAMAITADGRCFAACSIIGADGYRSLIRRTINPEHPDALYAGYLLWRGLVAEADLPLRPLVLKDDGIVLVNEAGHRLVAYPVAGPSGSLAVGQRLLSFAWYHAGHHQLLRGLRCLNDHGGVLRSLAAAELPTAVSDELRALAIRIWPDPWRAVILYALELRQVSATPVAEYSPLRLCQGRLAIIGDAAHVVSPVTGKGFVHSMQDAEVLAECLAEAANGSEAEVCVALKKYESKRLSEARALAGISAAWGQAFLRKQHRFS